MTMQSSAGTRRNPQYAPSLWLSVLLLAALAGALFLALLPGLPRPHAQPGNRSPAVAMTPVAAPAPRFPSFSPEGPSTLWTLLTPWVIAVDSIAILGLGAVLFIRASASRRRRVRR